MSADQKAKKKVTGVKKFTTTSDGEEFVNKTASGDLKDLSPGTMASAYYPIEVEAAWDAWWEKQGLFMPDTDETKEPFVMVIPPPNVTGKLHIGHALTMSIEDTLTRWNRMRGRRVLWVPGCDHAGIATQVVVEKQLMKTEQKSRHDLGREKFLEKVWEWKDAHADSIMNQERKLGISADWSRDVFTMDEVRAKAVTEAFVRMFDSGLIYRSNRIGHWSCALRTAISSIEVDFIDIDVPTKIKVPNHDELVEFGVIHSFAYKMPDGDELVVATTRIETMLGDVAVCVHPDDERYRKYHGMKFKHPFVDRELVVITDAELVDMNFGTGAVKITPAHDPNDFECGQRHNLNMVSLWDDSGYVNENGGDYKGMKRFELRVQIIKDLEAKGLFRGQDVNKMRLGLCSRSGDVIEPMVKPQWWVNTKDMAKRAVDAVRNKELKIVPEFHEDTWYNWLENIREWCISRQLWWGHRIPAYAVKFTDGTPIDEKNINSWVVGQSEEVAMARAKAAFPDKADCIELSQDPDVLDTWFSSGLFPFSAMGWPDQTSDLKSFFPGQLLETGHDIIFFWVARMVMMSLQLQDCLPFNTVYLHAMVKDKSGKKMSKTLGNVIDPMDVIYGTTLENLHAKIRSGNLAASEVERACKLQQVDFPNGISECGADALRFGLLAYTLQGRDINLDINRVVGYRQFCNKLWNATAFATHYFDGDFKPPSTFKRGSSYVAAVDAAVAAHGSLMDKWILSRLASATLAANESLSKYEFAQATMALHRFWLESLCATYLESIKPTVQATDAPERKATCLLVLCR
jgi:valyl-tRNA synthetase